ncbi:MAG TPA: tetratricopeptide repeat protein [Longilinea sp.]|nr:tetratricopeptide repeat protein [Longilinea sp.]
MQTKTILTALQKFCNPNTIPQTLTALRQDALLWSALSQMDLEGYVQSRSEISNADLWAPASLALYAIGADYAVENLSREPMTVLDGNLQRQALAVFEETLRTGREPIDLREAGLLALALRERRRKTRSWSGISNDLTIKGELSPERTVQIWNCALSCLYRIIPDGGELLKALITENLTKGMGWCIHILLSNPADEDVQARALTDLIEDLPIDRQAGWLERIRSLGRFELAEKTARILLVANQVFFDGLKKQFIASQVETKYVLEHASKLQHAAVIYHCAGASLQSAGALDKAQQLFAYCLAGAQIQSAYLDIDEKKPDIAATRVEKALLTCKDSTLVEYGAEILQETGLVDVQIPSTESEPGFVSSLYLAKQMAAKGNMDLACQTASRAVEESFSKLSSAFNQRHYQVKNPVQVLKTLLDLNLTKEAKRCSEVFLQNHPNDIELLRTASQIAEKDGDEDRSIGYAELVVLLQPLNMGFRRELARLLEDQKLWSRALPQRRFIFENEENPKEDDQIGLANCAIQAGESNLAVEISELLLASQPDHGIAHTLKGQALIKLDRLDEAIEHLSRATLLCADSPRPWIALAQAQRRKGDSERSLETLRAAVLAVPESPEVHFQLARTMLDQGLLTDALPNLRQAARLSPEDPSVTIELAQTLRQLGHQNEAVRILSEARKRWPKEPQLAYLEAVTFNDLGNRLKAVESLDVAVKSERPQIDWLRLYIQMQVQDPDLLYSAMPADFDPILLQKLTLALQKILAIEPADFSARMWMADILRLRGQNRQACDTYQILLDECGDKDPVLHTRVQAGFGAAALAANDLDTALACLQEVLQANPEDLGAMHLLAETYFKLNLTRETSHAAEQAIQLEPDQVNNLIWYAGMMERLGKLDEAQHALATAAQLSPERGDLWLKQAQFALSSGQSEKAQKLLLELEQIPNVTENELVQAARIHIQLKGFPQALSCLKKLESLSEPPAPGLLCDLAFLSQQTGDFQSAMNYAEQAVQTDDQNIRLHVLQADLLVQQGRQQAALACLEKATRLMENKPFAEKQVAQTGLSLFVADDKVFNPAAVYARSAMLLKQQDDIPSALCFGEKALESQPNDPSIRLLLTNLAYSQLQFDHVLELTSSVERKAEESLLNDDAEACWQILQAIRSELLLDTGNEVEVSSAVNSAQEHGELQSRLKAIQMRLLARNGEYELARKMFTNEQSVDDKPQATTSSSENGFFTTIYHLDLKEYAPIWLGQAAQDLYWWDIADGYFEKGRLVFGHEAISHFQYAKGLVTRAKAARLCEAVHATAHSPKAKLKLGEAFENALLSASQYSGSPNISELRQIGKLVLQPNDDQFKRILTDGRPPVDRSALVIALARNGNLSAVIQAAGQEKEQPDVFAHSAVAFMDSDLEKAMVFAQQAVEVEPRHPIYHALRAIILSKINQPAEVMEAWQSALQFWPDEPTWRADLAKLSMTLGDTTAAVQHWDAAFTLQPDKAEYAFNLGKVYLEKRNFGKAIDVLETASRLDVKNPQSWLALAEAHLRGSHLERALQCVQRAVAIEPDSLPAMLLQGEILIQMGNLTAAQEISDKALTQGNSNPDVVVFNVHLLEKRGKQNEALAVLEQTSKLLPNELSVQLERAILIRQVFGSTAALPIVKEIVQKFGNTARTLALQATVQYECNDATGAEKSALQALRLEPGQANLHLLLGRIKAVSGQLDQAVFHLSEAVQLNPSDVEGYLELGKAYQDRREQEKAILTLQQAIKAAPRDTRAYVLAAAALREAKDYSSAETMLRKAAELAPNDLNIRRQLGAVIALNLVQHSQEAQAWH